MTYAETADHVSHMSEKKWTLGSIYGPLYRLEQTGYLNSTMGSPTMERGGKSKRFYKVTPKGLEALREIRRVQQSSWDGLADMVL